MQSKSSEFQIGIPPTLTMQFLPRKAVAGATRTDYYFPNQSFPTSVVVTYNYDGVIIVNTSITLYPLTVTKTTCSLETLICEDW